MPPSKQLMVRGPFWRATVHVLGTDQPQPGYFLRSLFLDPTVRPFGGYRGLVPESLLALCWVREVVIQPVSGTSYRWARDDDAEPPSQELAPAMIKTRLAEGKLALLALAVKPAELEPLSDGPLPEMRCLAGDIGINELPERDSARTRLYQVLRLTPETPGARPGPAGLVSAITVHAGGVSLFGSLTLPWDTEVRRGPFALAKRVRPPAPGPAPAPEFRLALERERLTAQERSDWSKSWRRLAGALNPGNPLLGAAPPTGPDAPSWVTAEVANPNELPLLAWEISPWRVIQTARPLHIGGGEIQVLLSDRSPYHRTAAPTSLARAKANEAIVRRQGDDIVVELTTGEDPGGARLRYSATRRGAEWNEQFTLDQATVAFDPVATPALLRELQGLPPPVRREGATLDPPVVWGFVRLEDGWAQVPVPNLTEEAYAAAKLVERPPSAAQPTLRGALVLGNDRLLDDFADEQPWSLALTDAGAVTGQWTLRAATLALGSVTLELRRPEVALSGLLWFGTSRPSTDDALPDLDDWLGGLRTVSLRTVDPETDLFPPLVIMAVGELVVTARQSAGGRSAALGTWSLTENVDTETLRRFVERTLLPDSTFGKHLALAWRRHPTLPMIQALPLTQNNNPPSYPSASRQLVPFELPVRMVTPDRAVPADWRFGVTSANGAAQWPRILSAAVPDRHWQAAADLPLASLSVPGLILDPHAPPAHALPLEDGLRLPLQYRYDLPYTDEIAALAQAPREPARAGDAASRRGEPRSEPAQPLDRETLVGHWGSLSGRATLAAADAVDALRGDGGHVLIHALVEPATWRATFTASLARYPGSITVRNADGAGPSIVLEEGAALAGIGGHFVDGGTGAIRLADAAPGGYDLVAGSMLARAEADGSYRDQRGLMRHATQVGAGFLRTPVRLATPAGTPASAVELTSTLSALELHTGAAPGPGTATWRLWFRDLPIAGGTFLRTASLSGWAEDVNDPEAGARERNHLSGYEWRLVPDVSGAFALFGLRFYPLSLARAEVTASGARRIEIIGRLQLPLAESDEIEELGNAVVVKFEATGNDPRLVLTAIDPVSTPLEWPLAQNAGELTDAPRLRSTSIALVGGGQRLEVGGAVLLFSLFGAEWRIPLAPLRFDRTTTSIAHRYVAAIDPREAVAPREALLVLDLATGRHEVSLVTALTLGRSIEQLPPGTRPQKLVWQRVDQPQPLPQPTERSAFRAAVRFTVMGAGAGTALWEQAHVFGDVPLGKASDPGNALVFTRNALELSWTGSHPDPSRPALDLQFLPGMHLEAANLPGFAVASWRVLTAADDVPTLRLESSFVETLVTCRWGTFLQGPRDVHPGLEQVCGSSAGDLVFGYTARSTGATFRERVNANGLLEVKNLISWPHAMQFNAAKELSLPPANPPRPAGQQPPPLDHVRHTIRVLVNQHEVPVDALEISPGDLVFRVAAGRSWQFLAVVEHQLVDVWPGAGFDSLTVDNERRWTVVQEVRLLSPSGFKGFLRDEQGLVDGIPAWSPSSVDYDEGDVVRYEGNVYRCRREHESQPNWNPHRDQTLWRELRDDDLRLRTLGPSGQAQNLGSAVKGYLRSEIRELLAEGNAAELDALAAGTLIVEASAACWIRQEPVASTAATALQYLPGATQMAILTSPDDLIPSSPAEPAWLLFAIPFLGRLQAKGRDAITPPASGTPTALQIDPVLHLQRKRAGAAALPPLALALATWAATATQRIKFPSFDTAVGRTWSRLDPMSLEEALFRLHHPPLEPAAAELSSVVATLPDTPARLGRGAALARAFDVHRAAYPPEPDDREPPGDPSGAAPVWRPDALLVHQADPKLITDAGSPWGWHVTAVVLATSPIFPTVAGLRRFVAVTQLPAFADAPISLAVSPYLGLELRRGTGAGLSLRLVVAELLCLDRGVGALRPVATHTVEGNDDAAARSAALVWARECHRRLSPESPIAVVRFREVHQVEKPGPSDAVLATRYRFALVPDLVLPPSLSQRVLRLRAPASQLRFRDGQFGGESLPPDMRPFELAPPQMTGLQPIRLEQDRRPVRPPAPAAPVEPWPWGLSALRASVRYTDGADGVIGDAIKTGDRAATLYWQSLPHRVQFRAASPLASGSAPPPGSTPPAAGLPPKFRGPAIRSLLPVLPDPPLPALPVSSLAAPGIGAQPVVPGAVRTLLTGVRPGVMVVLRPQLQRQSIVERGPDERTTSAVVSGSIPVQHRAPRPVALPENRPDRPHLALRTWTSAFEPRELARAVPSPVDEAYFAGSRVGVDVVPARRLRFELHSPRHGVLPAGWKGALVFRLDSDTEHAAVADPLAGWAIAAQLVVDGRVFVLSEPVVDQSAPRHYRFQLGDSDLAALVPTLHSSAELSTVIRVGRTDIDDGFSQRLSFPLVAVSGGGVSLPLSPVFVHFEDPEYNRRLASAPKRAARPVRVHAGTPAKPEVELRNLTLAADRAEYDAGSVVSFRYDWDDDLRLDEKPSLRIRRIDRHNTPSPLRLRGGADPATVLLPRPGALMQLALLDLEDPDPERVAPLVPGELLEVTVTLAAGVGGRVVERTEIVLTLAIVADPVVPAPEAGYALLHRPLEGSGVEVECARFAWSPAAARVDLVSPADLRTGIVRRRAVFRWRDTVRRNTPHAHAIQKVCANGATHVPVLVGAGR